MRSSVSVPSGSVSGSSSTSVSVRESESSPDSDHLSHSPHRTDARQFNHSMAADMNNDHGVGTVYELPPRLFSTDRFPDDGRVNSYSKMQYVIDVVDILDGTKEFMVLKESQFGDLFNLPTARCSLSGKLVHNLLCRQLISQNQHEMWFTFGGIPLRFSVAEFERVTGLNCGPFPPEEDKSETCMATSKKKTYWEKLFGNCKDITIADIVANLREDPEIPGWKRLRLVLLVIVEGILRCETQPVRPSSRVVEMVRDVDRFLAYPWGRESFFLTMRMIRVGERAPTRNDLVNKLKKSSVAQHGFPLAIQLWLFEVIPSLLTYLPRSDCVDTFLDRKTVLLPRLTTFHTENILRLELHNELAVTSRLVSNVHRYSVDIDQDPRVSYLEQLLDSGSIFAKSSWCGGDSSLSPLCLCSTREDGRCGCVTNNLEPTKCYPVHSTAAAEPKSPCPGCADLKQSVLRLEEAQARMEKILAKTVAAEVEKMRVRLLEELFTRRPEVVESQRESLRRNPESRKATGNRKKKTGSHTGSPERNLRTVSIEPKKRKRCTQKAVTKTGADFTTPQICRREGKEVYYEDISDDTATSGNASDSACSNIPFTVKGNAVGETRDVFGVASGQFGPKGMYGPKSVTPGCDTFSAGTMKKGPEACHYLTRQRLRVQQSDTPRATHVSETGKAEGSKRLKITGPTKVSCPSFRAFPIPPHAVVARFKRCLEQETRRSYDLDGHVVHKNFFKEIYTPQHWVQNSHIDLMLRSVWRRCGSDLVRNGVLFADSYLTQLLVGNYNVYLKTGPSEFKWSSMLRSYVYGYGPDREDWLPWGRGVTKVYTPMNWGCRHWVALLIDLQTWQILILDPLLTATPTWRVDKYMEPVAKLLPELISAFCPHEFQSTVTSNPLPYERVTALSSNDRGGDCGPLVVKFIELHSHHLPLSGITVPMVDQLRMAYALDVYSAFVSPLS